MRTRSKLLVAAIAAIAVLGMGVQSASARNLSIVEREHGFRIAWSSLELEAAGFAPKRCPVTLEGTFELNSFAKRTGTRIGAVTAAAARGRRGAGECTGGEETILTETLPWAVQYDSFTGTLPNIGTVTLRLIGVAFQVHLDSAGFTCLARTETGRPARGIATVEAGGRITQFNAEQNASIETTGGFFCTVSGGAHMSGAASFTGRAGATSPRLRLI